MIESAANELPSQGKGKRITVWVLSILAALLFLFAGVPKLMGGQPMVAAFAKIGFGQWFRYVTGILEIAGAIGLLMPRFAFYSALLLSAIMAAAVVFCLTSLGESPVAAIVALVLTGAIAYLRKP